MSYNALKRRDDTATQFLKLFKNEEQTELFGWLNTFPSVIKPGSVEEYWAIVSRANINLYSSAFRNENLTPPPALPSDYKEWVNELKGGPCFEGFIHRTADYHAYSTFYHGKHKDLCDKTGDKVFGVYNSNTKNGQKNLVMVTLQSPSESFPDNTEGETFEQISLLTTLEADKPWFIYTEEIKLPAPVSYKQFISERGIGELQFTAEQLVSGGIEFELVNYFPELLSINHMEKERV
jgi:hypothetical protein